MNKTKQLVQLFPHSYFISRGVLTGLTLLAAGCGNDTRDSTTEAAAPAQHSTAVTAIASAELSNYSAFARSQESVYFSYADLGVEANTADKLAVTLGSSVVPFQAIDTDSDGENDGIVVAIDLDAEGKTSIEFVEDAASSKMVFTKQTQAEISHKEGGEWKPHTKTEGFQEYVGGSFKNVSKLTPPDHYTDHSNWIRYEGPGILNPTKSAIVSTSTGAMAMIFSAKALPSPYCKKWVRMAMSHTTTSKLGAWIF